MSLRSCRSTLAICAFAVTTLLATNFSAQQSKVLAPQRPVEPTITPRPNWHVPVKTPRSMVGGLWMIDANFRSTIYLKNGVKNAPVMATPVLYLSNGKRYTLPDVNLDPSGTATVNINDALAQQGIAPWATLSGYVEIKYTWAWHPICVTVQDVDTVHSLIFTYNLRPASSDAQAQAAGSQTQQSQTLQGMWWKQESNVAGFVALSNVLAQPVSAKVQTSDNQGMPLAQHAVTVSPHGTKIVKLDELSSARSSEGGVTVTYTGTVDGLLLNGGLQDPATGYSANMRFSYPRPRAAKPPAEGYAELGLMAGAADPMMSFPVGTVFTPYSIVRNITDQPILITPTLWWMEAAAARSAQLPQWTVPPHATQSLPLESLMSQTPLKNFNGSFNLILASEAPPGSFLLASGSVDQSHTYVFEVIPQGLGESIAKSLSYWSTANGDDTMVTLWNPADEAQNLIFTLFFAGGSYRYPVPLGPRATRTLNVSEIIQNQLPDENGNTIPTTVHEGSAEIAGAQAEHEHILIGIAAGTYNVRKATCAGNCITCSGYVGDEFDLIDAGIPVGSTTTATYSLLDNTGTYVNVSSSSSWSSSSTSIATVNNPGWVAGVASGAFIGYATSATEPEYDKFDCPTGDTSDCPEEVFHGSGDGTITDNTPILTGINPSDWTAGATTPGVIFTGQYFGTNAPTLAFSPSTGITHSLVSYNDTKIVANITVASGTPNEDVSVSVTNNGYGGSGFASGGGAVSPTSAPINATVHAPINSPEVTVIAWVNGQAPDLVTLPSGANATLISSLNSSGKSCGLQVASWALFLSPTNLSTQDDRDYANAWLVAHSANSAPPGTIVPGTQLAGGNYRLFNDWGNSKGSYNVGTTPDPCSFLNGTIFGWLGDGQPSQYMGKSDTSASGKVYQIAEGRIGTVGQRGSQTINQQRTVPFIYDVIEFDTAGNPTVSDHATFPTYYVYISGVLQPGLTVTQSTVKAFVTGYDASNEGAWSPVP